VGIHRDDSLIGRDTVNTLPPETLAAFKDHGTVSGETILDDIDQSPEILDMLAEVGIDMDQVTKRLQDDGVDAFATSFESLIEQVDGKRTILMTGLITRQKLAPGIYGDAIQHAVKTMDSKFINARIWAKDGTVWKDHGPTIGKIEQRLGWLNVLETMDLDRLKKLQAGIKGSEFGHIVLLGMGGSSLAPEVLYQTFGKQDGFPVVLVLDSTVPARVLEIERAVDLQKTLFIVASKSGGTVETARFYDYFYAKTGRNGSQFIAITDPGSDLAKTAETEKFRDVFLNPADIGGRYSALSYFGLVPAALMGIDLDKFWANASEMILACGSNIPAVSNPGVYLGTIMGTLAQQGRDKLVLFASPSIVSLGNWIEQLVAESTGKEGKGILPIVGSTVGKPHDYASDRVFVYLKVEGDPGNAELDEGVKALREAGHPRVTLLLEDKYALAGEFFRWELATAVAGHTASINPFDELNVTESKQNTSRLIEYFVKHGSLPKEEPTLTHGGVQLYSTETTLAPLRAVGSQHGFDVKNLIQLLAGQILGTNAGDYFAILAYLPPTPAVDDQLEDIRRRLRHVTRRGVTIGYGPRYLHSTGQLHKGGANNGIFLLLTYDHPEDVAIPGSPYSFGILNAAQAAGDFEALDTHKRRVLRLHLNGYIAGGINVLLSAIDFAGERSS
jgi:transaldolase/glucose-6-phosphate isomerase